MQIIQSVLCSRGQVPGLLGIALGVARLHERNASLPRLLREVDCHNQQRSDLRQSRGEQQRGYVLLFLHVWHGALLIVAIVEEFCHVWMNPP